MSKTHCICAGDADRPARMLGIATLTMVASSETMRTLMQQDAKTMALRRALSARTTLSFTRLFDPVGTADDKLVANRVDVPGIWPPVHRIRTSRRPNVAGNHRKLVQGDGYGFDLCIG